MADNQKQRSGASSESLSSALRSFGATVAPVKWQFLLAVALTMGVGATKKLSFDAQSAMHKTIFEENNTDETSRQYKFIAFGFAKAFANVLGAIFADKYGKKNVLMVGWTCGIIFALMVIGEVYELTVWSNIFLGFQQGIVWSLLIFTMVDYAGPNNRALAVGLNETFGYTAVAVFGKVGPEIWLNSDDEPNAERVTTPFYGILVFMVLGLVVTYFNGLKDTRPLVQSEQQERFHETGKKEYNETITYTFPSGRTKETNVFRFAFVETSFLNNSLMACCVAGLAINYCSTFAWGLGKSWAKSDPETYPGAEGRKWGPIDSETTDNITLTYDLTKGLLQFLFGFYADRIGRRTLIVGGLSTISAALISYGLVGEYATSTTAAENGFFFCSWLLGFGTSMMYAIVIAAVGESADPSWRSSAIGSYRFWRDSGYAVGGLLLGYATDEGDTLTAVYVTAVFMALVALLFHTFFAEVVEGDVGMERLNSAFQGNLNTAVAEKEASLAATTPVESSTELTTAAVDTTV